MRMKTIIALTLTLSACTITDSGNQTTLPPLPTTSTTPFNYSEFNFIDDFYYYWGQTTPQDETMLLDIAKMWCQAIQMGMQAKDIQERINEGAADEQEARLHEAIVKSAVRNLCPINPPQSLAE